MDITHRQDQTVKVFSMDYSKVGGSSLQKCRLQIANHQSPQRNIPEHFDSDQQRCENLSCYKIINL